jgi:hypothetical protein
MRACFTVAVQSELRDILLAASRKERRPMSHIVAEVLAEHFKRPELAVVPRGRAGRRRKAL